MNIENLELFENGRRTFKFFLNKSGMYLFSDTMQHRNASTQLYKYKEKSGDNVVPGTVFMDSEAPSGYRIEIRKNSYFQADEKDIQTWWQAVLDASNQELKAFLAGCDVYYAGKKIISAQAVSAQPNVEVSDVRPQQHLRQNSSRGDSL